MGCARGFWSDFMKFFIRFLIAIFFINFVIAATKEQIEISAQNFEIDEKSGLSVLSGNVLVKKDKDILRANKVSVFLDKNNKPLRYEATQNPSFELVLDGKLYKGRGDKFVYQAKNDTYEILGNAHIEELSTNKRLYGDKIIINRKTQTYNIDGTSNKPVRFVFELDEKELK